MSEHIINNTKTIPSVDTKMPIYCVTSCYTDGGLEGGFCNKLGRYDAPYISFSKEDCLGIFVIEIFKFIESIDAPAKFLEFKKTYPDIKTAEDIRPFTRTDEGKHIINKMLTLLALNIEGAFIYKDGDIYKGYIGDTINIDNLCCFKCWHDTDDPLVKCITMWNPEQVRVMLPIPNV